MRRIFIVIAAMLALHGAHAAPCTTATPDCAEWIAMEGGMRGMVYRSQPLATPNAAITRAVVVVHGGTRDAHNNFRHLMAAAFLAGALEDTVVVSPRFAASLAPNCNDKPAENELYYDCNFGNRHWNSGGVSLNGGKTTSYDVLDEIVRKLANRATFPNLKAIVVAGHSSGGQFVTRYAMTNRMHSQVPGIAMSYFVSNPGAYTYLDGLRPTAAALPANVSTTIPGHIASPQSPPPQPYVPYRDARNCTQYDDWPYGLKNRAGYSAAFTDAQLTEQLVKRPVSYVLGELDVLPLVNFDVSCNAMAQGASRLARGLAFSRYIRENHGAQHPVVILNGCGHSTRCMFTADQSLPILFPKN